MEEAGLTAAVAHKLGLRWVTCEQIDDQITKMLERLNNTISGDDDKGISADVNWQGGGSFVYCELAKANQNFVDEIKSANSLDEIRILRRITKLASLVARLTKRN